LSSFGQFWAEIAATLGTYGSLPKIRKGRFGSLRPLGVKDIDIIFVD
jgi:hypothetical protein